MKKGDRLHSVTARALATRLVQSDALARLLQCSLAAAEDILAGHQALSATEAAILRLICNTPAPRARAILADLADDHEWRPIDGFPNYEVSEFGEVRRRSRGGGSMPGAILRPTLVRGYQRVTLYDGSGAMRTVMVHRAVCRAFCGEPSPEKNVACHRNDQPTDNRAGNLYWGTAADNAADRLTNRKLITFDETDTFSTQRIRKAYKNGDVSRREAARLIGISMAYDRKTKEAPQ